MSSDYDFFYLLMHLMRLVDLRYVFVNFMNVVGALRFQKALNKYKWDVGSNCKTCEVSLKTIQEKRKSLPHAWHSDQIKNY